MMKQTNVLALAVVIVVAVVPSIAVAFVVLPPYAAVAAAAARLNYHPNGDLGGGGYPPMTGSEAYHLGGPESSAFPPPMGLEGQLPDGDDPLAATYDRALDCANNFGMCEIDELLDLSEELDEYMDSCYVEDGPEACENEIGVSSVCVQRSSLPSIICVIFYHRQLFCMQCTFQFFYSTHLLILLLYHNIISSHRIVKNCQRHYLYRVRCENMSIGSTRSTLLLWQTSSSSSTWWVWVVVEAMAEARVGG